jgi:[ribosomal protein S18]-alanine N-acetyltransferase
MTFVLSEANAVVIRDFVLPDVPAILKILSESPEAAWPAGTLQQGLPEGAMARVAVLLGNVVGFLIGRQAADEFEILNMGVSPAYRRRGIGSKLVDSALESARKAGGMNCYLEVRVSNEAAIHFYVRHGFKPYGRRKGYYQAPFEDALLFVRLENRN